MLVLLKVVLPVNMTFLKLILWNMQLKKSNIRKCG